MKKKTGTIQVDMDGLWTNLEYYGYKSEIYPDVVFESSIPRFLDLFAKYNIRATFFLVGKDGECKNKIGLIREISKAGHEIANHSYSHRFGFRKLSSGEKLWEISKGEEVIRKITGKRPLGFKAPGFDLDGEILKILEERGYLYDSSIIPTPFYPLILRINRLFSGGEKRTYGPGHSWVFAPHRPYHPSPDKIVKEGEMQLREVPCSVMPWLRVPFHPTFAAKFGRSYFNFAYQMNSQFSPYLNYAFHAADLSDDLTDSRLGHLSKISFQKRFPLCEKIIGKISHDYEIVTTQDFAEVI
ncbi:MAG: polysaccharide deacetylase family protein [Nanoarchaeota archaeon]